MKLQELIKEELGTEPAEQTDLVGQVETARNALSVAQTALNKLAAQHERMQTGVDAEILKTSPAIDETLRVLNKLLNLLSPVRGHNT